MRFLIDTGAFYALADDSDRNAPAARAFFQARLEKDEFVTTSAIIAEVLARTPVPAEDVAANAG